jgi:energy-coupling factor transport system ATP-binding protein
MRQQITNFDPNCAINVDHLKIVFNDKSIDRAVLLEDFSYKFEKNKIYFIIGNSGSGKTSLVSHFNGLLKSKYGNLLVGQIPILANKRKIKQFKKLRKTVGMVFQFPEYQLFKDTIEKDIIFGPINLGESKSLARVKAEIYLNKMGLSSDFLPRSPFGLSGGQKRRVAIAGILAIEPDILVFDEPTAGLDPAGEKEMLQIIQGLKSEGKTVFVITHVMDQVLALGDEVLVLGNQKILAHGAPYDIFTNQQLLNTTTLDLPKVIKTINGLIELDPKFQQLMQMKPKDADQLAAAIAEVIRKDKHE